MTHQPLSMCPNLWMPRKCHRWSQYILVSSSWLALMVRTIRSTLAAISIMLLALGSYWGSSTLHGPCIEISIHYNFTTSDKRLHHPGHLFFWNFYMKLVWCTLVTEISNYSPFNPGKAPTSSMFVSHVLSRCSNQLRGDYMVLKPYRGLFLLAK